jgi:DNA repair protein RadC
MAELVALVTGKTTDGGAGAIEAAHRLVTTTGGSARQLGRVAERATSVGGDVPTGDALRIAAALELGRRAAAEPYGERRAVNCPQDVIALVAPVLEPLQVEEFHVITLNAQHVVIADRCITRGILDSTQVHPREVFRAVIEDAAASVILVHNHPSGDPTASAEDRVVTSQLVAAGALLGIPVRDHVIIGHGRYVSFAEAGWLGTAGAR